MELQVGVKILLKNKKGEYLVIRRSADKYPKAGAQWEIVGGRIDISSSLVDNLAREVMEETGLTIVGNIKLITAQDIFNPNKHIVRLTYLGKGNGLVKLSNEHTDFKWLSIKKIKLLNPLDPYLKYVLKKFKL